MQSTGDFIDQLDALGWTKSEAVTSATHRGALQPGPGALYKDMAVRKALIKAVDNKVVLELGYSNLGTVAENHHVCPIHPEYFALPPLVVDPAAAKAEMDAAGHAETEFELISLDDAWQAATCDAVAAQIRDAGIKIKRTVMPGSTFWNDWPKYPFSATEWNMRPLGVQIMALAYSSGEAWNETGMANPDFDAALAEALAIADADKRKVVMQRVEADHAGRRRHDSALLALDVPPLRRQGEGCRHAPDLRASPLQVVDLGLIQAIVTRGRAGYPAPPILIWPHLRLAGPCRTWQVCPNSGTEEHHADVCPSALGVMVLTALGADLHRLLPDQPAAEP